MENDPSLKKTNNKLIQIILFLVLFISIALVLFFISKFSSRDQNLIKENDAGQNLVNETYSEEGLSSDEDILVASSGVSPVKNTGEVLAVSGAVARNDVAVMSSEAPHQGGTVSKSDLPVETLNIDIENGVFSPKSFITSPGLATFFAISSKDGAVHTIIFDDPLLSSIAISVGPNQTRGIMFNAPSEAGSYFFRCITPGHEYDGEVGEMIVK